MLGCSRLEAVAGVLGAKERGGGMLLRGVVVIFLPDGRGWGAPGGSRPKAGA